MPTAPNDHPTILTIRPTVADDVPRLLQVFAMARELMRRTSNPDQWRDDYPDAAVLQDDVRHGDSFVFEQAGRIVGTFVLREGADPTYAKIYSGQWLSQEAYATIHRIAGTGEVRGLLSHAVAYARKRHQHLRIDTHRDNAVMQKAINKAGFVYCGIIHCRDGSDRLAYEWLGKTSHLYEKNGDALT
ncbi:MAG: GNAT family N-acetyltransferase [Alloprevotella sp.]|nr:GNAT family N-acetyltransferase [Alloprevotella sp.]